MGTHVKGELSFCANGEITFRYEQYGKLFSREKHEHASDAYAHFYRENLKQCGRSQSIRRRIRDKFTRMP